VKYLLKSTAVRLPNADPDAQGAGLINVKAAKDAATPLAALVAQPFAAATGLGTLEGARGSVHVTDGTTVLTGELDIFGATFDSSVWAAASLTGNTWSGNTWSGNTWSGNTWAGNTWSGNSWSGNTWSGNTWSGNTWSGNTWAGNTWAGIAWSSASWGSD
jgi:hypothetical protein